VRKERTLGAPIGGAEECTEPGVAVIPAHDELERAEPPARALPDVARHPQRDPRARKLLGGNRLRHEHRPAARGVVAIGEHFTEKQAAAFFEWPGEMLQCSRLGVCRDRDLQSRRGGGSARGFRKRRFATRQRVERLQWQPRGFLDPAHQVRASKRVPQPGQCTRPARPDGSRSVRAQPGQR